MNGEDDKFRSRRWMLTKSIQNWSMMFAALCLLLGALLAPDSISTVISAVLLYLGGVNALIGGVYLANRAVENWSGKR